MRVCVSWCYLEIAFGGGSFEGALLLLVVGGLEHADLPTLQLALVE